MPFAEEFWRHPSEYISEPPISTIRIQCKVGGSEVKHSSCVLRVETGIKIEDVYAVWSEMMASKQTFPGCPRRFSRWHPVKCTGLLMLGVHSDMVAVIDD